MKNLIKTIVILLVCLSFSFSIQKKKQFIPPGTVQITETFFADECEISNLSWVEYETWTREKYGKGSAEHLSTLPDTLVWRDKQAYNEPYVIYYYRHPAYKNYPLVGISHQQALAFCKWRTERVKEFFYIRNKKEIELEYRLPTKEEWEMLSMSGCGVFNNNGKNAKGMPTLNCVWDDSDSLINLKYSGQADVTAPVYSYWKNRFGLYNCIGNVAEMVREKGICKGGSWRQRLEECRVGKDIPYSKPEAWLGFRCVCVLKPS